MTDALAVLKEGFDIDAVPNPDRFRLEFLGKVGRWTSEERKSGCGLVVSCDTPPAMGDLVTARLVLHPLSIGEAEQVVAGESDGDALWAPGYPTDGDVRAARRFLSACADNGNPQPLGAYEIRRRDDGHAIGGLGFHGPADQNGSVTIGYGLIPSAQGKGYASEALRALLVFARGRGIGCVEGDTDHDNLGSQHVMTAVGMRLVAEDERLKYYKITWTDETAVTDPRS